ncbi:MAG: PQQ-binding-like beta-propeller repeat protein [Planctomycetales bacterium]
MRDASLRPNAAPATDPWHRNLVRERSIELRLRTARGDLQAGRITEALRHLQAVLDGPDDEDVFVRMDPLPVPLGARSLAEQWLGQLAPEARQVYETLHGSEARRLLERAMHSEDPSRLTNVIRRFFHTQAGGEASATLARRLLDQGHFELAAALWERVLDHPDHRRRLTPAQRANALYGFARAGDADRASHLARELLELSESTAPSRAIPDEWLRQLADGGSLHPLPELGESAVIADHNASGSPPALAKPLWTASLAGPQSRHIADLVSAWEPYQRDHGLPIGAAHQPLIAGERLIFRDYEGIRAVSLRTGGTQWYFPAASSLSRDIPVPSQPVLPGDGNPDPNNTLKLLVGNCLMGVLSGNERLVFAIDQVETGGPAPAPTSGPSASSGASLRRQSNVLLALEVCPEKVSESQPVEPRWVAGGRPANDEEPTAPPRALAGHFFLGPPLVLGDRLFAVSEFQQQLHVSRMRGMDGGLEWSQPICSVPQPFGTDHHRSSLICTPSYGGGVLVCPTQAGLLAAVDPVTGRLLWAAPHDDGESQLRQQMSAWPYSTRRRYSHPGYISLPVIHGGRVIYLPAHSEYLHCFELATGRLCWRVPREDLEWATASDYIAAVGDGLILVVGRRRCRAMELETGAIRYSQRLASTPAGRGVRLGIAYHIPLDDGRIVSLEMATGRVIGETRGQGVPRLGNLLAAEGLILSMGRNELSAWPQATAELARIEGAVAKGAATAEQRLDLAELELALGRAADARSRLQGVPLPQGPNVNRRQTLEREALLACLAQATQEDDRRACLDRLAQLAETPHDRGRYLWERARFERSHGDKGLARQAILELSRLPEEVLLGVPEDPSRVIHPAAMGIELLRGAGSEEPPDLEVAASQSDDPQAIRRLIELYPGAPGTERARLRLAQLLIRAQKSQQAELALLECRESPHPPTAAAATRWLAELWDQQGLHHDAGRLLGEIERRYAAVEVADGLTGAEYLRHFPRERGAWQASRQFVPSVWSKTGVSISESVAPREELQALYNGNVLQALTVPREVPFDLFDKGRGATGVLTLVDRHTGAAHPETIQLPGPYYYPVSAQAGHMQHSYVGNLLPVGGTGGVHGVSLLERNLVWSTTLPELRGARDRVRVGPAGPGFCICQYRQHLFVLDPSDGRLKWRRDDLEAMSGLMSDTQGIIGDERVLVVFSATSANAPHFTVYDTATGEELRRGQLDLQTRFVRRAYGRRLFHFTNSDTRHLRVWDPLTDQFVWDEAADQFAEASLLDGVVPGTKIFSFIRDTSEAAFVTKSGSLRVVDLSRGATRFDLPLDESLRENLSSLRAFCDQERYYFNLQRSGGGAPAAPLSYILSDAVIPAVHVQGELCAVDRRTAQVLWTRSLASRSVLQLADYRLPVLVTLFRLRPAEQTLLAAEVLDARTGITLAARHNLFSDRLLQLSYERQPGVLTLRGGKTEIRVDFEQPQTQLSAGDLRP